MEAQRFEQFLHLLPFIYCSTRLGFLFLFLYFCIQFIYQLLYKCYSFFGEVICVCVYPLKISDATPVHSQQILLSIAKVWTFLFVSCPSIDTASLLVPVSQITSSNQYQYLIKAEI